METLGEVEASAGKGARSAAGLVLITPFTHLGQVVGSNKLKLARVDLYDTSRRMAALHLPIFAAHGLNDEVVDIKLGRKAVSRAQDLWQMLEIESGHYDIDHSDDLADELIAFVDHVGASVPDYRPRVIQTREVPAAYRRELTVDNWLQGLGLSRYSQTFLVNGYFSMDIVRTMQELDLLAMGIADVSDQKLLLSSIEELRAPTEATSSERVQPEPKEQGDDGKAEGDVAFGPIPVNPEAFTTILQYYDCTPSKQEAQAGEPNVSFLLAHSHLLRPETRQKVGTVHVVRQLSQYSVLGSRRRPDPFEWLLWASCAFHLA